MTLKKYFSTGSNVLTEKLEKISSLITIYLSILPRYDQTRQLYGHTEWVQAKSLNITKYVKLLSDF